MTATIIPFRRPDPPSDSAETAQARLVRALASLDQAMVARRTAIAGWRELPAHLLGTMQGLGHSLDADRGKLDDLAEDVGTVNRHARQLETWADDVLAAEATGQV
jgi:hypothetical protein